VDYWIVLNGAPKCGSTWLVQLLEAYGGVSRVPPEFQNKDWYHSSVIDKKALGMVSFLKSGEGKKVYYSKQHWLPHRPLRVKAVTHSRQVFFCNIYRDVRDTFVSRYFHDLRLGLSDLSMSDYFAGYMRRRVEENYTYHDKWVAWAEKRSNRARYILASYEALSDDLPTYGTEFLKDVWGACACQVDVDRARESVLSTHFSKKAQTGEGEFFRKGKAGGWNESLDQNQAEEMLSLCEDLGYGSLKNRMCALTSVPRRYFEHTDVGC
jgi:hypothetical protein